MKSIIFDIDGTLADLNHRLHHIQNGSHNWDAFFAEAGADTVIEPIRELALTVAAQGYRIILVSGRTDKIRDLTANWLVQHQIPYQELLMRKEGDTRPDYIVKSEILDVILAEGHEILCVIDDRPSVVAMWRERGLICLQCADASETYSAKPGLLSLMVGPSGAGKSTWLHSDNAKSYGIVPAHVVSSDQIRSDLFGDFRNTTENDRVFEAVHAIVRARVQHGLPAVIDATNMRRKYRITATMLAKGGPIRYFVIDRPMEEKVRDAGWRAELPFDLLARHQQTFGSQLKEILRGDDLPNVQVIDLRTNR